MTQSEKLEALIERAVEGSWDAENYIAWKNGNRENILAALVRDEVWKQFIFNHDFAKALFGDDTVYVADILESPTEGDAGWQESLNSWEYHLQQAVIDSDPVDYLYKAVFK